MKKNDWILIAAIVLIAGIFWGIHALIPVKESSQIEIMVNGQLYGKYSIVQNQTVEINDTNKLEIQDGKAKMIWAKCPDQICVNQKEICKNGESIICLPNKVVVSVDGGEQREIDATTN